MRISLYIALIGFLVKSQRFPAFNFFHCCDQLVNSYFSVLRRLWKHVDLAIEQTMYMTLGTTPIHDAPFSDVIECTSQNLLTHAIFLLPHSYRPLQGSII